MTVSNKNDLNLNLKRIYAMVVQSASVFSDLNCSVLLLINCFIYPDSSFECKGRIERRYGTFCACYVIYTYCLAQAQSVDVPVTSFD